MHISVIIYSTVSSIQAIFQSVFSQQPLSCQAAAYEVLSKPLPEPRPLAEHYTMTVCYKEFQKAMAASWFPGVKKIDDFTVTYAADRPTELSRCRYFIG